MPVLKKYYLEHFNRCSDHCPYMHFLIGSGGLLLVVAHSQHKISAITSSTRISFLNLDQRAVVSPSIAVCTLSSAPSSHQKLVPGCTWGYNPQLFCVKWCWQTQKNAAKIDGAQEFTNVIAIKQIWFLSHLIIIWIKLHFILSFVSLPSCDTKEGLVCWLCDFALSEAYFSCKLSSVPL